jgi:hypothetical protein
MDRNELMKQLSNYGGIVKDSSAKTSDFVDIKNKIRAAYDAGNIDKEMMKQLGDKASGAFKNIGRTADLIDLPSKILEKGGSVGGLEGIKNSLGEVAGGVIKGGSKFGKLAKMLAMAGPAAAGLSALSIGNKAMAGDIPGAGMEAADLATDYLPGVGTAKMALNPSELGKGSDLVQRPLMTQSPMSNAAYSGEQLANKLGLPKADELVNPEQPSRFGNIAEKLKRNKLGMI